MLPCAVHEESSRSPHSKLLLMPLCTCIHKGHASPTKLQPRSDLELSIPAVDTRQRHQYCSSHHHIWCPIHCSYRSPLCPHLECYLPPAAADQLCMELHKKFKCQGRRKVWCVRTHAHARGVWGHAPPENYFQIRCSEIASEAIFVPECH